MGQQGHEGILAQFQATPHSRVMEAFPSDLTGQLLIAMPGMSDPRFARSVVYMCAHSDEGAMGLILNKPAPEVRFSDLLEQLDIVPKAQVRNERVYYGGPVETGRGFVLHSSDYLSGQGTMGVTSDVAMTATLDILEDIAIGRGPEKCMLALGYSGWGPGQLESEIVQNGWLTVAPTDPILWGRADEHKWSAALKALGIDPLSLSDVAGHA